MTVLSAERRLHYKPFRLRQKKKKKRNAAIQRKGLYFESAKPNESVGLWVSGSASRWE